MLNIKPLYWSKGLILNKNFYKTNYHYFFFIIFFIIQLLIFNDYGFPSDDKISRFNGLVSFNHIIEKLNIQIFQAYSDIPKLENYLDKDYGVVFELLPVLIEKIFNLQDTKSIYYTRHYLISFTFFIGSIFFYLTLRNFFSKNISLLGTIIFISHPRIFAESFYNSKDIVFLVFFCISNYFFLKFFLKQNFRNILLLSLSISLAICIRPMALIIPFLFLFFFVMQNLDKEKLNNFIFLLPFLFFTSFFTILFWPYLWDDPSRIFEILRSMGKFRWIGEVFFNGEYFVGKYMPWYYVPITIIITSPFYQIILFFIGFFISINFLLKNLINLDNSNKNIWSNKTEFFILYSLIIIFLPIFLIIELNATVYNGWRQIYFIYPSIIFVCIYGLNYILRLKKIKNYIYFTVILFLLVIFFFLIKNHPYQYTFYNSLVSKKNLKNFELDYWGLSNLDILKKLNSISDNDFYKIYVFSVNPYYLSINLMPEAIKKKYIFVDNIEDAEFIVTNHYYQDYYFKEKDYLQSKHPEFIKKYLDKNFKLVYDIKSNNVSINSIYKKN